MSDFKILDIYLYHPITKEFLYKEVSDKNPLDPENPIIPACATTIEPPSAKNGYATVWVGNKWEYKEDHREEIWYNVKTKQQEEIDFIGPLFDNYASLDSKIANKPEEEYWVYDKDLNDWVIDIYLYKNYIKNNLNIYWNIKQNTPFEFNGFKYIPAWKTLYTSIWSDLKDGIKDKYRLKDYDGNFNTVTSKTFKPIYKKMVEINDEMYLDKHNLKLSIDKINDLETLEKKFKEFISKIYN